jgi:hypothetical protein
MWLPEEFLWTVGCSYRGQPTERAQVRNVYGGCCGLKRQVFVELGGYDARLGRGPNTIGGGEEAELCLRAQSRWPDGVFFHEPAARIEHNVTVERLRLRYLVRRAYDEGAMKATLARMQRGALQPERSFALQMPGAFLRHLVAGFRGDWDGFKRAGMIVLLTSAVIAGMARWQRAGLEQSAGADGGQCGSADTPTVSPQLRVCDGDVGGAPSQDGFRV